MPGCSFGTVTGREAHPLACIKSLDGQWRVNRSGPVALGRSHLCMVRPKIRHLLLEIIWKDGRRGHTGLTGLKIQELLVDAIIRSFGVVGAASILPYLEVRYFNSTTSLCIVRCPRDQQSEVLAAVAGITECNHRTLIFRLCKVGATINHIQRAALVYNGRVVAAMQRPPAEAMGAADKLLKLPKH